MEEFTITETTSVKGVKIVVVGVGGGGGNMVNHLAELSNAVKLVAANTDAQALENCDTPNKIQLGPKLTKGLGAGMDPEIGKAAAIESYEEIKKALTDY